MDKTLEIESMVTTVSEGLNHPLRRGILRELHEGEKWAMSPSEYAKMRDEPLTNVSYHFRELLKRGLIVETHTTPRRGALEHYYARTPLGTAAVESAKAIEKKVVRLVDQEVPA